jgi:hypothetical protein
MITTPCKANRRNVGSIMAFRTSSTVPHLIGSAGRNSSIGLPEGSSSRICLPPGPVTMSLRKGTPSARRRLTSASMSSTRNSTRFQPPGRASSRPASAAPRSWTARSAAGAGCHRTRRRRPASS